ncbi:unannotated protein [freshwater metagenome]|uniref:Unannotated protein n=1 Tax=freshwater metagenome TaxID=449393 RepID=A0A6J7I357_9ZZZZ
MIGSGALMCFSKVSDSAAAPEKSASSSAFSSTEPTTSPAVTGGSARTTGIWETPYSRRMSMASRTVSVGWVCTRAGSASPSPDLARSSSPTVSPSAASTKP